MLCFLFDGTVAFVTNKTHSTGRFMTTAYLEKMNAQQRQAVEHRVGLADGQTAGQSGAFNAALFS